MVDHVLTIGRAQAQVVKLANEFKDLNDGAQDGYNRCSAAVTAFTEAESMEFEEMQKQVNFARCEWGEGDTAMGDLEGEYESRHRYNIELEERAADRKKAA